MNSDDTTNLFRPTHRTSMSFNIVLPPLPSHFLGKVDITIGWALGSYHLVIFSKCFTSGGYIHTSIFRISFSGFFTRLPIANIHVSDQLAFTVLAKRTGLVFLDSLPTSSSKLLGYWPCYLREVVPGKYNNPFQYCSHTAAPVYLLIRLAKIYSISQISKQTPF